MKVIEFIKNSKNLPYTLGLPVLILIFVGGAYAVYHDDIVFNNDKEIIVLQDQLITKQRELIKVLKDTVDVQKKIIISYEKYNPDKKNAEINFDSVRDFEAYCLTWKDMTNGEGNIRHYECEQWDMIKWDNTK